MRNLIVLLLSAWAGSAFAVGGTEAYADGKTVYGDFGLRQDNLTAVPTRYASSFMVTYQRESLRFDLVAKSDQLPRFEAKLAKPVWNEWPEECFEIFLAPPGGAGFVQLAIGPAAKWDSRVRAPKSDADFSWTSEVKVGADGWTAVVTVPYASLGLKNVAKGDAWRFNVARDYLTDGKVGVSTWAAVGGIFNNPSKFATLYLCAKDELEAARRTKMKAIVAALRKELAATGLEAEFEPRLRALENGAPYEVAIEIRDEAVVVEKMIR